MSIIFFTVFIDLVGFGIVIPMLQPYALAYGATEFQAGLLVAVFSLFQFVFAPLFGWLSDRFGRKPVLLLTLLGMSFSYLVLGLADSLAMIFVGRIFAGVFSGSIAVAQAYVADVTPPEKRAHGMGMIGMAFGLGFILGPAIGGILSQISLSFPPYAAAVTSGIAFLLGAVWLNESLPSDKREAGMNFEHPISTFTRFLSEKPVMAVILANFLWTTTFSMWETVFVLFVGSEVLHGLEEKELATRVGYLFAYMGFLSAMIQGGLIRRLTKSFSERGLAHTGIAIYILGSLFFIAYNFLHAGDGVTSLIPALTAIAVGLGLINPTFSAIVSKLVSPKRQGEVLGSFRGLGSLGRVIGPVAGAILFAHVSHWSPYLAGAVLMGGAFLLLQREFEYHREDASTGVENLFS